MFCKILSMEHLAGYQVRLGFSDGAAGVADLQCLAGRGGLTDALAEPEFFAQLRLDGGMGTLAWPNGYDVAPEALYELATGRSWAPTWNGEVAEPQPPFARE
jgi:hypothetical protein